MRYLTLTLENYALFEGHHIILELCFQYDGQSQELSVTGFRKFLSVKEQIAEMNISETADFSEEQQEKLLSEYSKIFRETTEECSLVTIMLDTAVENAEEFERSCDIIQSEVAKCAKDSSVFFQLVVFNENDSPEEILINGRTLSPDGEKIADEIRKLHTVNFSRNAFHSFDPIYQTYGEIEKLDFLKLTYGLLCVLNYSHFPPLVAEDFEREMPNREESCLFALPSILNPSVRDFVNCFDWTSFLMRTKMLSEKQPEPQEPLPEPQPIVEPSPEPQPQKEQYPEIGKVSLKKNPEPQPAPAVETKRKEETNREEDSESSPVTPEIPEEPPAEKVERTTTQGGTSQSQGESGTNHLSKLIPIMAGIVFTVGIVAVAWGIFRNIPPISHPPVQSSSEGMDSSVIMDGDSDNDSDNDGGNENVSPNSLENREETGRIVEKPPIEDEDSPSVGEGQAPVPQETQPAVNQIEGGESEETESRYTVVVGKFTWEEAEKFCVNEGGHLASVHSEEDWNEIVAELERFQARNEDLKYFWLGGYSTIENDNIEFSWSDNTPTTYLYQCSHWYFSERTGKREPSGYNDDDGAREPYLMIWKPANSKTWSLNDVPDVTNYSAYKESNMGFVMERSVPTNVEQVTAEVEHSPEPEPVTVAVPQPTEPEDTPDLTEHFVRNNAFFAASATSQLEDIVTAWRRYTYSPKNVLNEDSDSCWAEGAEGDGIGESITLYADSPQLIRKICICNGLCSDRETFYRNNRVDECTISFDDGEFFITLHLSGAWDEQPEYFLLENPIYASSVTVRIDSVFQGEDSDTVITGIYFSSE